MIAYNCSVNEISWEANRVAVDLEVNSNSSFFTSSCASLGKFCKSLSALDEFPYALNGEIHSVHITGLL